MGQIVLEELTEVVRAAVELSEEASGGVFSGELDLPELLFQLRKDIHVLHRLINFMRAKESSSQAAASVAEEEEVEEREVRRLRAIREALERFDVTGHLLALLDSSHLDQLKRDRLSRVCERIASVSANEHIRLTEASQVSFLSKPNVKRFRDWLFGPDGPFPEVRPTGLGLEVLGFLGKEVVSALVDVALTARGEGRQREARQWEPRLALRVRGEPLHTPRYPSTASTSAISTATSFLLAAKVRERASGRAYLDGLGIDALSAHTLSPDNVREAQRRLCLAAAPDPFLHATTPSHWLGNLNA